MTTHAFDPAKFVVAGKALFTIQPTTTAVEALADRGVECKPHYTYKVQRKEGEWQGKPQVTWFVSLLTGSDNTNWQNYTYMGLLDADAMTLRLTAKSKYKDTTAPVLVLRKLLSALREGVALPDDYLHHEGRCGRCGRVLTVPSSVANGIGPECIKHVYG